jgi:hypothetical protein
LGCTMVLPEPAFRAPSEDLVLLVFLSFDMSARVGKNETAPAQEAGRPKIKAANIRRNAKVACRPTSP